MASCISKIVFICHYTLSPHSYTRLTQNHRTSWRRNLDRLVTSVVADWIRWDCRALGKGLRFRVYLLFGTKVESVCADLRDGFQIKGQCCPLSQSRIWIIRPICCVQSGQLLVSHLCCSVSIHAYRQVWRLWRKMWKLAVTGIPSPSAQSITETKACLSAVALLYSSAALLCFSSLSSSSAPFPPTLLQSRNWDVIPMQLPR